MTDTLVETEAFVFPEITLLDRCDRCIQHAVAVVLVLDGAPGVYLCGHHFRKNRAIFVERGYRFRVDPAEDVIFTNGFRDAEMSEAGVTGRSGT